MNLTTCIIGQAILLLAALTAVLLRFYARVILEKRLPIVADYLLLAGWFSALGWCIAQTNAIAILIHHPFSDEGLATSTAYLKSAFASVIFFDFGLMLPKVSITMFYWWLIPSSSRGLRKVLIVVTIYVACACTATFLSDMLFCVPIQDNWSLQNQLKSIWFSSNNTKVNWSLNISTDAILFLMPIFIFRKLNLRKAQKWSLIGVFSLGLITIAVSISRFTAPAPAGDIFGYVGAVWCTAELSTGIIVVSLPSLKNMLVSVVEKIGSTFGSSRTQGSSSLYIDEISGVSTELSTKKRGPHGRFEADLVTVKGRKDPLQIELPGETSTAVLLSAGLATPMDDKQDLITPVDDKTPKFFDPV